VGTHRAYAPPARETYNQERLDPLQQRFGRALAARLDSTGISCATPPTSTASSCGRLAWV